MTNDCCGPLKQEGNEQIKIWMMYWYILDAFPGLGRAPTLDEMERDLFIRKDQIASILNSLVTKGALRIEPTTYMILDAYPYSGVPTRHRVYLNNGNALYCVCAVDTFYVPFLTGGDLIIRSRCFHCRSGIEIKIKRHEISSAAPFHTVVWNSTASYDCPKTNFFCSKEHLLKWQKKFPDEKGNPYTLAEALNAGKRGANRISQTNKGLSEILWTKTDAIVCYCREVPKAKIIAAIARGASSLEQIQKETTACTGEWCKDTNPNKRCCRIEIEALIEAYSAKKR